MSKKDLLNKLYARQNLSSQEAEQLMTYITEGVFSKIEIVAIIMFYKYNSIQIDELRSFRKILLEKSKSFHVPFAVLDVCGTGGDEKDTFNISTLSALVIAACGYKVVKHGNYGASSISGSSNILEYFGYKFTSDPSTLLQQLEQNNICFLHAPLFHPALKLVAPIRKELGTRTFFNLLGPLVNPCNISHQFIGVNSLETMRHYHYLLQNTNMNYSLVHSLDGYDEISLTAPFKIQAKHYEYSIHPEEINTSIVDPCELGSGNSLENAAKIFLNVLQNKATQSQKQTVLINSAYAIQLITKKTLTECLNEATEAIENQRALHLFKNLTLTKHEHAR